VKTIPLSKIVISPDRQRRTFPAASLQEFADGISKRGLLHPIILRHTSACLELGEVPQLTLVAGERRLRAITDLAALGTSIQHDGQEVPLGHIPYTLFTDLSPLAAEEAELEENTHREDLTWQDRAAAVSRLASLRNKQAAESGKTAPTVADIATEVRGSADGSYHEATRRELLLAPHLSRPEIAAAKSAEEAFKILKRVESTERNAELGLRVGRTFSSAIHTLRNTDALTWLQEAPAESFDVILTDPPYGMGADEFGDSGGAGGAVGGHAYVDDEENFHRIMKVLPYETFRVAKAQAHLYLFCDPDWFIFLRNEFRFAKWTCFRTPLIWLKKGGMRAPWPKEGPQRKWECLLYAVKGKRQTLKLAGDVLDFPPDSNLGHSAQKPVALFQELLSRSVRPGDTVLDPFCGTGPIFPAAHTLKCAATGIEMDTASYGIAVKRVEGLDKPQELPE